MAVNGRYVYITTNTNPAKFLVFDVSNPANPWRVGGINLNSGEDQGRAIAVSGKYAYVTGNTAPAFFTVIDMSSPAAPTRVGGTTLEVGNELSGQAIAISGRYAFAAMNTDPTVLTAIDISNPTAPTRVSRFEGTLGVDLATSSLSLNGKYAYIISDSSPTRVSIIDVSNASSLVRVANFTLPTDENGSRVFVSGRYAYFASGTSPIRFSAYELPGLETATAEIGSLEAGTLSVSGSLSVQQNLNVDSLTVGPGGLLVQGDAAADSFIANGSFEIPNRFLVNVSSNRVEFGSRALNTTLFVNGSINATGAITSSGGFDLAEAFSADEPLLPGELVVATSRHSVRKATAETAHLVLGAVSTQPGFLLDRADIPNRVFIGLSGRVPVSVEGDVRPGDFITASSTPGKGRAATSAGFVIGRAISSVQADGTVLTIIQPMYFSPQVTARGTLLGANAARVYTQTGASSEETVVRTAESVTIALAQSDVVVTLG